MRRVAHRVPVLISTLALALAPALSACGSDEAPAAPSAPTVPATATSAAPAAIVVPDVAGERPLAADQKLTGAGLHAHITGGTGRGPGGGQCVVTEQHPDAGSSVRAGTTIELGTGEVGGSSPC